jgi:hypothetical protein
MFACPFCDSSVGRQVAEGIAREFWTTAAAVIAPLPVLALIVVIVGFVPWFSGVHHD